LDGPWLGRRDRIAAFMDHDSDEIGPGLLPQIAKKTGLRPEDL
jgi:hypothetical protein